MGKLFVVWFMFALENVKVVIRAAIITGDSSNNATKHQMLNRMQLISAPKTKKEKKSQWHKFVTVNDWASSIILASFRNGRNYPPKFQKQPTGDNFIVNQPTIFF